MTIHPLRSPSLVLLAALALSIPGCSDDKGASADAGSPGNDAPPQSRPDSGVGDVPSASVMPCRYTVPVSLGLEEGKGYECGDLSVYENRDNPGRAIKVHYVRFSSGAASSNATIYFEGGPGGNGSGMVARVGYLGNDYLNALMIDGDFIVIGQRGTTLSIPSLDCDSAFECMQLSDDLPAYNTAYNADDVDDLRRTLGYEKFNIYGISYGSRLALEVLRRHGEHIRSATVGGLVPSQIVWTAGIPASFYGALSALNDACVAHGSCQTAFGDLRSDFVAGVYALNENPVSLAGGGITLDGYTYASLVFQLMYARSSYPWLPMAISDLAQGQSDRVESFLVDALSAAGNSSIAYGMYYSVVCGEMFSPPNESAFAAMNVGVPQDIQDIYGGSWYWALENCSSWPTGTLQAGLAQPVTSAVPTFVASGAMDPITPPGYGQVAADSLSNALVVVYESSGHGATVQTECGRQTFLAFLADPSAEIDLSCASALTIDFVLPSFAPVPPVSRELLALEMQLAPVPPLLPRPAK